MTPFQVLVLVAAVAATSATAAGWIGSRRRPSTAFTSVALGFAAGVLIATITFEMIPRARELASTLLAGSGFAAGLLAIYAFDLVMNRGRTAGLEADQRVQVDQYHRSKPPRGDDVTVLAGATTFEQLIEGLSIAAGAVAQPAVAVLIAASITLDNIGEGLAVGARAREHGASGDDGRQRGIRWSALIGLTLFVSALASWLVLRNAARPLLGFLIAFGAGGMLYLTITDLVPEAERRQVEQTSALAAGAGFVAVFAVSSLL